MPKAPNEMTSAEYVAWARPVVGYLDGAYTVATPVVPTELQLKSPDGTVYNVSVDDEGVISAAAAE
jgi:hypothetical protein